MTDRELMAFIEKFYTFIKECYSSIELNEDVSYEKQHFDLVLQKYEQNISSFTEDERKVHRLNFARKFIYMEFTTSCTALGTVFNYD